MWECDGRVGVSEYGEDVVAQCGVWVDVEGDWLHPAGDLCRRIGMWEAEESDEEVWTATGCFGLPEHGV